MDNVPHHLTEQIWHRFIRLQYQSGDISTLKELNHLRNDEFQEILSYLIKQHYVRTTSTTQYQNLKYYITDSHGISGISDVLFYLPEGEYSGPTLKKYIDNAIGSLGDLIVNTTPLNTTTNPPGTNAELIKEQIRLRGINQSLRLKEYEN